MVSDETRRKMSEAKKGKPSPKRGIPLSEETKKKISESRKGKCCGKDNHFYGKTHTPEVRERLSKLYTGRKLSEETRNKMSEARKGEKCYWWKGGVSYEPYCIKFNKEFKERVRNFFGRNCVECGKTEEENKAKMCVHHVNFNKETCCDDTKPLFVTLCRSCHGKTQFNREFWEERYTKLIDEKYNGQCYLPKLS